MDTTRLSASTFPYREGPLEPALEAIARAGYTKVDLLGKMPHMSLDPAECDPSALRAKVASYGLTIANLATYVADGFADDDPGRQAAELDRVRRAIDVAVETGARSIRVYRGGDIDDPRYVPVIVPWMRKAAAYAEDKNVYMGIENHGGGISGDEQVLKDLFEQVGSRWFGCLYDPCNLHSKGGRYREALTVLRDHIVHVHIKDGTTTFDSQITTMLGDGEVDVAWVLGQLDAAGYDGDIAMEYELEPVPPETGLKQWFDYMAVL